jgi:hypothetical protein
MEQFLAHVEIVLPMLGIYLLRPPPDGRASASPTEPGFTYSVKGVVARAREVDGEFVVLKDSRASAKPARSWDTYQDLRAQLIKDGALIPDPSDGSLLWFMRDVAFSSPSAAGSIVSASNVSGRAVWKVEGSEQTYGEWQDTKIAVSESVGAFQSAESMVPFVAAMVL